MERLLIYGSITNDPLYNCSARTPEMIKLSTATPNIPYGTFLLVIGIVTEFFLFLCVKAMLAPHNFVHSAYKLMAALSIGDMISIIVVCCIYGSLSVTGTSFCDWPNLNYVANIVSGGFWIMSSQISLALIANRLIAIGITAGNSKLHFIFDGKNVYFYIVIAISIALYSMIFHPPTIFHVHLLTPIWDPLIYPNSLHLYFDNFLLFNNCFIVSCTAILYIVFCFKIANTVTENRSSHVHKQRLRFFAQCSIIVGLNFLSACIYILANIICLSDIVLYASAFVYPLTLTMPTYTYLLLNHTIRKGVIGICVGQKHAYNQAYEEYRNHNNFKACCLRSKTSTVDVIYYSSKNGHGF